MSKAKFKSLKAPTFGMPGRFWNFRQRFDGLTFHNFPVFLRHVFANVGSPRSDMLEDVRIAFQPRCRNEQHVPIAVECRRRNAQSRQVDLDPGPITNHHTVAAVVADMSLKCPEMCQEVL